jgi:hypothetical protein
METNSIADPGIEKLREYLLSQGSNEELVAVAIDAAAALRLSLRERQIQNYKDRNFTSRLGCHNRVTVYCSIEESEQGDRITLTYELSRDDKSYIRPQNEVS